jgi:hypothetical protein
LEVLLVKKGAIGNFQQIHFRLLKSAEPVTLQAPLRGHAATSCDFETLGFQVTMVPGLCDPGVIEPESHDQGIPHHSQLGLHLIVNILGMLQCLLV